MIVLVPLWLFKLKDIISCFGNIFNFLNRIKIIMVLKTHGKWCLVAWPDLTQMLFLWEMHLKLRFFSSFLDSWEMCSLYARCPKDFST